MPTGLGGEQLWISPTNRYGVSSFNDLSDASRTTYIINGTSIVSDTIKGGSHAIQFNGTSDTTSWLVDPYAQTGTFSWSAWFNSDTLSGTQSICGGNSWSSFSGGFLFTSGGVVKFVLNKGVNGQSSVGLVGTTSLSTNTWYHVCVKGDGTNAYLYLNGSLEVSGAFNGFNTPWQKHFRIGTAGAGAGDSAFGTNTHFFDGKIDDVRVYSRELNQSEITHLATARGVEGNPFKGLGDEQLWLCPSLQDTANDLSNNNNNGTYIGGLATIADSGAGGNLAYNIDTTSKYVDCGNILDAPAQFSISAWVNRGTRVDVFGIAGKWNGSGYMLYNSTPQVAIDGGPHTSGSTQIPASTWQHLAATYDGTTIRLYQDGVETSSQAHAAPSSTSATYQIGAYLGTSFRSLIDDVRQYDRVLTQSEITHLTTARGIQGRPFDGLGGEQLWLCPSLNNSPNDISGNNNGVYNGGMGTVADTSNGGSLAYDFDGTNDYISNSSLSLAGLTEFSYSGWLNASTSSGLRAIFSHGDNLDYDNDIYILNNNSNFQAELNNGSVGNGSASLPALNTWHHIAIVFDGSGATNADRLRYFLNGVEVTLTYNYTVPTSTSSVSPMNTEIGSFASYGALHFWQGKQDDIRVYKRALTQSEISWLATKRGVLGTRPAGLGGEQLWISATNDNTGTSTAFNDLSGNSNDGTSSGATIIADTSNGGTYCIDFNGSSDVVTPYKDQTVTSTGVFSMALWVKYDSVAATCGLMAGNIQTNNTGLQMIFDVFDSTRGHTGALNPSVAGQYSGLCQAADRDSTSTGTWYHVAYTGDGTTARLYINGTEVVSQAFGSFSTATWRDPLTLGCFYTGISTKGGFLDGQIDDARMFGRTITQSEVTHLASQRGVLGAAPVGLGGEQLWLCPSIQDSPNDISGNNNNGVYNGGMGTVTSDGKLAYNFDGVDDYIECSGPTGNTGSFSLSVWASRGNGQSVTTTMAAQYDPVSVDRYWLLQQKTFTSGVVFRTYPVPTTSTGRVDSETTSIAGNGVWYHATALYDATAGEQRLYIDGVLIDSDSSTGFQSTTIGLLLGWNGAQHWLGRLDDIRTYSRVLTQAEISWLSTERGVLGTPPEGLGGETCWICPTLTQNSTTDITSSGLTITTTGSVTVTADTGAGGTHANFCQGNGTNQAGHEVIIDNFGNTYAEATSVSWWSRRTAGAIVIEMGGGTTQWPSVTSGRFFYQRWSSGQDRAYMYNTSGGTNGWIYETGSNATWKHHVMVREGVGGKNRLYINGVLDTEEYDDGGAETTGKDMYFGIGGGGSSDGELYVDDMRTYGRILTQDEITHLASQRGVLGSPTATTQYNAFLPHAFRQLFQTRLR